MPGRCSWRIVLSAVLPLSGLLILVVCLEGGILAEPPARAGEPSPRAAAVRDRPACVSDYFVEEVWAKIGERTCLKCHVEEGEASGSEFLLRDPARMRPRSARREALDHNLAAFEAMADRREGDASRLLLKVVGELDHGGGAVLEPDSSGYRILERLVARVSGQEPPAAGAAHELDDDPRPFFEGIEMIDDRRLLRRVTLSLAGRLPSPREMEMVDDQGLEALDPILDQMMEEDAFYERLQEGFNDIFLTLGYDGVPERVLSYNHFGTTRHWTQEHDLSHVPEEERTKARYALTDDYRKAILREPLELIAYIVRNDRPFTEIATADYILVTPYSARGYGIYEELKDQFDDPDDPFEYIPTKLEALKHRDGQVQESTTGYYPHSGMLSMFHYLARYPTTETNRNRLRARMYYQHFLGIDVMELAPQVTDAAAVDAKFANPTMEAADCVVCHKTIDPVAGLFQDFYSEDGSFEPRRDGWFTDMFAPGFEGEDLPGEERWRALQWLGERTIEDPRFAAAMVEHVYYILTGRQVLQPPRDIDDPQFASRRRAYLQQREMIDGVAERFVASDYNLKEVFKALVVTPFYRADGLVAVVEHPRRAAELEDVGVARLLGPEQLDRKLRAIFGSGWDGLTGQFEILYGGIDSRTVTERISQPSGAMGALQRMMANEMACKSVPRDFHLDPSERHLFPNIEIDVVPGSDETAERQIREAIVHLHERLLGRAHPIDDPEVDRTYELFAGIVEEARQQSGLDPRESYFCRGGEDEQRMDDPHYTLRGWRAVVTYLLRQHDFLYE